MTTTTTALRKPEALDPELVNEFFSTALNAPDPYPLYARLRRDHPVVAAGPVTVALDYDAVAQVLRHPEMSTDDRKSALFRQLVSDDRLGSVYLSQMDEQSFLHRDPPDHTRLRRLAAKGFTPRRVEAMRAFIQRQVDDALDAITDNRLEIINDLAYMLPIDVICELIGIPVEDREAVASWPRTQLCCSFETGSGAALGKTDGSRQVEADRIQQQLTTYFDSLIERRRANPGDDLVSDLIAAEESGDKLTTEEVNATLRVLFVAGYENVVNLIGHGMYALLRHPDQWDTIRRSPALASAAVEEVLRYDPPFQFTSRIALSDLDIGGYHIEAGQSVTAWIASANRDPAHFADPDRFDIHREPGRHFGFGTGIHACMGGPLARMEGEVVFATLANRLVEPKLELDPPPYRSDIFRSLETLPVTVSEVLPRT